MDFSELGEVGELPQTCGACKTPFIITMDALQYESLICCNCNVRLCTDHFNLFSECRECQGDGEVEGKCEEGEVKYNTEPCLSFQCKGKDAFNHHCGRSLCKGDDGCNRVKCDVCLTPSCAWCGLGPVDYTSHYCRSKVTEWPNKRKCEGIEGTHIQHCPLWHGRVNKHFNENNPQFKPPEDLNHPARVNAKLAALVSWLPDAKYVHDAHFYNDDFKTNADFEAFLDEIKFPSTKSKYLAVVRGVVGTQAQKRLAEITALELAQHNPSRPMMIQLFRSLGKPEGKHLAVAPIGNPEGKSLAFKFEAARFRVNPAGPYLAMEVKTPVLFLLFFFLLIPVLFFFVSSFDDNWFQCVNISTRLISIGWCTLLGNSRKGPSLLRSCGTLCFVWGWTRR